MPINKLLAASAIAVAIAVVAGCRQGASGGERAVLPGDRNIDDIILDINSDDPAKVEMAVDALMHGKRPAAEMQKALPALEAAAKKNWRNHPRMKRSLQTAIKAVKSAGP